MKMIILFLKNHNTNKYLELRPAGAKGNGVFAIGNIGKGSFLVEYAGELLSKKEAEERERAYQAEGLMDGRSLFFNFKGRKYWYVNSFFFFFSHKLYASS